MLIAGAPCHKHTSAKLPCPAQDEVLAHRLGLVPLAVHPDRMELKAAEEAPSEKNTLVRRAWRAAAPGGPIRQCPA